ncbi:MAG: diguanylate cyclase [Dactylosporangium sp.]|nr:diguanylate cyclase [Dactylosporangium sp.]
MINPQYSRGHNTVVLASCAVAIAIGLLLVALPDRTPRWVVRASPLVDTGLIALCTWVASTPTDGTELLMVWPVLFASYYLGSRDGWFNVGAVVVSYTPTAMVVLGSNGITPTVYMAGTTVLALLIVSALRRQIAHLIEALQREARTDGLTGLLNRRAWDEAFHREVARRERQGGSLSLLIIDIDYFKRINDTMGHPAGDAALRKVAALLQTQTRAADLLGRVGGEEFAIVLVDCDVDRAAERAEQIRALIEATARTWPEAGSAVTVSIGAAAIPEHATDGSHLMTLADHALYAAKTGGRNAVRLATSAR